MANAIVKKYQVKMQQIQDELKEFKVYIDGITDPTASQVSTTKELLASLQSNRAAMLEAFRELAIHDSPVDAETKSKYTRSYLALYERAIEIAECKVMNATTECAITNTRLPEIALPKFSGAYQGWLSIRDTFLLLVGNNATLNNLQKLHYLRGHLEGEAHQLITPIPLSDGGYELAWARLVERFENNCFLIKRHVQELLSLPITKRDNHKSIRNLINSIELNLAALKQLNRPIESWDDVIIELVAKSLDQSLCREWEGKHSCSIPTLRELLAFLQSKALELEAACSAVAKDSSLSVKPQRAFSINHGEKCAICENAHYATKCPILLNQTLAQRRIAVKEKRLCFNCLRRGHQSSACPSSNCRKCHARHHILLHPEDEAEPTTVAAAPVIVGNVGTSANCTMLSTCVVKIVDVRGNAQRIRALLDGGSEVNLVTAACAKGLGCTQKRVSQPLTIAGGGTTHAAGMIRLELSSWRTSFSCNLEALIIPKITGCIPSHVVAPSSLRVPSTIPLADPDFGQPAPVELLIGNGAFLDVLLNGKLSFGGIRLHNTVFGWILGGHLIDASSNANVLSVSLSRLDATITRFWEMEGFDSEKPQNPEEQRCEEHFAQNATRQADGRMVVCLPFKGDPGTLGNSSQRAKQVFLALERRLSRNPETYERYRAFMLEYEALGHMSPTVGDPTGGYYLPHHCVLKESSLTTKLRVVFNGSFPTSSGTSLNHLLMVGPRIQDDLMSILIRMRGHRYLLTADIKKMYRQVMVRREDRQYQRIWWRASVSEQLRSFELNTVTYGTASASYLAIKALRTVASAQQHKFPLGVQRCLEDFYVDDLITGSDDIHELAELRRQVIAILQSGGFQLSKWACNHPSLLFDDSVASDEVIIQDHYSNVQTLGMSWNPLSDTIRFQRTINHHQPISTKHNLLSRICSVYDPLGLIGPVIIRGKILMQDLWKLQVGWDDPLLEDLLASWTSYEATLSEIHHLTIRRRVVSHTNGTNYRVELHGFCDDKERRSCHLLCAKSRVAPLKAVSIPRLELAAALLLAELYVYVRRALKRSLSLCRLYTDSEIVLAWLRSDSRQYKVYVANRVGEIQRLTDTSDWRHVRSEENPADLISRGTTTSEINDRQLWWQGPFFIVNGPPFEEPTFIAPPIELKCSVTIRSPTPLKLFGCYRKTVRVWAYVLRFVSAVRGTRPTTSHLTIAELQNARSTLIKNLQFAAYPTEIVHLQDKKTILPCSKLLSLNPLLDADGILRLGGRLEHASMPFSARHPIILPPHHVLTRAIVRDVHLCELHPGVHGTMAALRRDFWIVRGRDTVKGVIRDCVVCRRAKPIFHAPMMAALPRDRTTATRPFLVSGVDYAGPLVIKDGSRRSKRTIKVYVCLFVCFSTKAVHIESVGDLSTPSFLAAVDRFTSRRGMVARIYSDNATNFMGARNYLRQLGAFLQNEGSIIISRLSAKGIEWKFIPPRSPHFGGLWEAAVKQVKHHLRRVAGNALLTMVEMNTLLHKIEAILNSRPLVPLSDDSSNLDALTPGHFLIGEPLRAIPQLPLADVPMNRLDRWQLVQRLRDDIWKRWHREYLSSLHPRPKWKNRPSTTLQPGQLVILREDHHPPQEWLLGRIDALHTGPDGIARSATVRTQRGT